MTDSDKQRIEEIRKHHYGVMSVSSAPDSVIFLLQKLDEQTAEIEQYKIVLESPTVHILRTWDRKRIVEFALHLLGDEYQFRVDKQAQEITALKKEIEVSDQLIEERNRLLKVLQCDLHGDCVPGAIEKVEALKKQADSLAEFVEWVSCINEFGDPPQDIVKYATDAINMIARKAKQALENYRSGK